MAADASDVTHEREVVATCCVVLHGLQGEHKELRDVPLRETFAAFCRRVREVTGAVDEGHDVQLVHGACVLTAAGTTPLSSLDVFQSSGPHVELTYLIKEVPGMGFYHMVPGWGEEQTRPEFDQALFNRQRRSVEWAKDAQEAREKHLDQLAMGALPGTWDERERRSVEWAKDAQEAREKRLDQLVVGSLRGTSDERSLCMGSRPRLAGEVADAAWWRRAKASESNGGVDKSLAEESFCSIGTLSTGEERKVMKGDLQDHRSLQLCFCSTTNSIPAAPAHLHIARFLPEGLGCDKSS
ncbi:Ank2 [Symbiodinium sp. CCMP2456]|nr:Ank2 [Symbiodinium sp. CCMP2456]